MEENILEKEVENILREDYFKKYDATPVLGNVDFSVALPKVKDGDLFERKFFLWAEAKRGNKKDILESYVQLILTIGKEKTHEKYLPPNFLGAFDKDKISFIEFHHIIKVLYENDFNWNVTPSNHQSKEFKMLYQMVHAILVENMTLFYFKKDEKELRQFIAKNFLLGKSASRIQITKNNYLFVFQRWVEEVKPSIDIDWNDIPPTRVVDFFYADLISANDFTRSEDLAIVLRGDHYKLLEEIKKSGRFLFSEAYFLDQKEAYKKFWNKYERPPQKDYIEIILSRRELLIPHDLRKYQGAFFTPPQWVQLSQEYLSKELGENWQDNYYVWDCCAGTGNLLYGLQNPHRIWASTLDQGDVQVMKDRIREKSLSLLPKHVFKFDFLNESFENLPPKLLSIINNEETRKRLVIFINPPMGEAADQTTVGGTGKNKKKIAVDTLIYKKYQKTIGLAGRELFALFLIRISKEITGCTIGTFATLKLLQGPSFKKFRESFKSELKNSFVVPGNTFDNVTGEFPIGFFIWKTDRNYIFKECQSTLYESQYRVLGVRNYISPDGIATINDWIKSTRSKKNNIKTIGFLSAKGCDFQNQDYVYIVNEKSQLPHPRGTIIKADNLKQIAIYFAVRHCVVQTWINNQDQFFSPNRELDEEFENDCLIYTLFDEKNKIQESKGTNNWIPFSETDVDSKEAFESNFMYNYINDRKKVLQEEPAQIEIFDDAVHRKASINTLSFSDEARNVLEAGKILWKYYHAQEKTCSDASLYDIRRFFQKTKYDKNGKEIMVNESNDPYYMELYERLKISLNILGEKISKALYYYGFLRNRFIHSTKTNE